MTVAGAAAKSSKPSSFLFFNCRHTAVLVVIDDATWRAAAQRDGASGLARTNYRLFTSSSCYARSPFQNGGKGKGAVAGDCNSCHSCVRRRDGVTGKVGPGEL